MRLYCRIQPELFVLIVAAAFLENSHAGILGEYERRHLLKS